MKILCSFLQIFRNMHQGNQTTVSEFLLLGLSNQPEQQKLLFVLFLGMYLVTVVGNGLIILAIGLDSYLHTPMYLFLANLSFADISSISTSVPKMLMNIHTKSQSISYESCITQMYFSIVFVVIDNFLLGVMAYDRFVAICHPLNYRSSMQPRICILLTVIPWLLSNIVALIHTLLLLRLIFCDSHTLPHFFCDLAPLLKLSCSDTMINELALFIVGLLVIIFPFALILFSYICIVRAVLRISSIEGKWKAFSTCGSHLTVVLLFYGTIIGVYFFPSSTHRDDKDKIGAVMFTVVTPMMNPFIYSLKNKDMKGALRKLISRKIFLPLTP
ncbi:PREDICTED: olfactory receptor 1S1-like [Ceratotherium simum simum]|uniref:Olfactory receptor n=1 Tax=Ceratotherium simum simum TaxID=73337 RepID=A0ABM0I0M7_CERSS|nr:PREDICTED: olfactory receptor 1S1-like [Ceratotherium simum simum]